MTIQEATSRLNHDLRMIYEKEEAAAISDWIIEHVAEIKKTERSVQKEIAISSEQETLLKNYTARLLTHEPVQYVLNEAWFCGLKFYVDKNVLIPRPETEELVEWVIANCKFPINELSILDIGSGSGCIPVSLKRKIRKADVSSCDVTKEALQVARKNANTLGADVNFMLLDFLDKEKRDQLPSFDIIISNPPYITQNEKWQMALNVLNHEPHMALFAPGNDSLIFYRAIAEFGKTHLNPGGAIYLEIPEISGKAIMDLFQSSGYEPQLKKDMQQKDRMIRVVLARE